MGQIYKLLLLSMDNSVQSAIAETLADKDADGRPRVFPEPGRPKGCAHPWTLDVLH